MAQETPEKRGRGRPPKGRPFLPGNPGGPGRPVTPQELKDAIRGMTTENLEKLKKMRDDPKTPHAVRAKIMEYLLDRGYGRPAQEINLTGETKLNIVFDEVLKDELGGTRGQVDGA